MTDLRAPFPWFGGKSRAGSLIWERLGDVDNYVEPFAGSLAVLLAAPRIAPSETVNDADGFVSNFWRALQSDCEAVEHHADWPVNENDLHARHAWLVEQRADLTARLEGDPEFYDSKIAGWWVWGICCWIGSGWCSGKGPWGRKDGKLVHLGDLGRGVNRQRVHLGDLADRLRRVRVCCGDWSRVCGPTPTVKLGVTGVVLDPPYSYGERMPACYSVDSGTIATDVRRWALEAGGDARIRIAMCGYEGEHEMTGWTCEEWKTKGGYSSQGVGGDNGNKYRERIWFSPHCLRVKQGKLFG